MQRASVFTAALLALGGDFAASGAINEPVKIDTGMMSSTPSTIDPEVRIFKGIPYAAPPVGSLRWKAPQPPAKWEGVRKSDEYGAMCLQGNGGNNQSEDCLFLNVRTAAKSANDKLPVMLWLHGGGNYVGNGGAPQYDGVLAKKGVVVVTINFRLGPFGFFAHPELTKESDRRASGNYGLMDAIAALQWVQRNIAAFGGDPKKVTLFGESAGSQDVANLMASPLAKGLFQRAIGESSSWTTVRVDKMMTLGEAEQVGSKLGDTLGAKTLADLRAKPAADILKSGRGTSVIQDGWVLPEDPHKIFAEGKQNDVPLLLGSNRDEGNFFITQPIPAAKFIEQSRARWGDKSDEFLKLYPATNEGEAAKSELDAASYEVSFVMRNWARLQTKTGKNKAYLYFWTHEPPAEGNTKGGKNQRATHTVEINYVFQSLNPPRPWTDLDKQLSDTTAQYWANFAATGDPNGKGLPKWPVFDEKKTPNTMVLGDKVEAGVGPNLNQTALYQSLYDKLHAK